MEALVSRNYNDAIEWMIESTAQDTAAIQQVLTQARAVARELTELHVSVKRSYTDAVLEIEKLINECEDPVEASQVFVFARQQLAQLVVELLAILEEADGAMLNSVIPINNRVFVPQEQAVVLTLDTVQ